MTKKFERHPLSAAMGDIEPEAFVELQDSVGNDGVHEAVVLYEGKILDGWSRYTAASGLMMDFPTKEFDGTYDEACKFVQDKHFTRRNWNASQRALARQELMRLRGKAAPGAAKSTLAEDAAAGHTSERTARQARVVSHRAAPEVKQAVMNDSISIKQAEQIARLPRAEQRKVIAKPPAPAPTVQRGTRAGTWKAAPPKPEVGASKQAMDEAKDVNRTLAEELDRVTNRLAVLAQFVDKATDEERGMQEALLAEKDAEIKTLRATNASLKAVNGELQTERNELLRQCAQYRNQLVKNSK